MLKMSASNDHIGAGAQPARTGGAVRTYLVVLMIVVFPLLVAVAYFASRSTLPAVVAHGFSLPQGNFTTLHIQTFNYTTIQQANGQLFPSLNLPSLPSLPRIDPAIVLLVLAAAVIVLILFRGLLTRAKPTTPFEDESLEDRRHKVAAILDVAAAKLSYGSDYRATVIQCYKQIAKALEERTEVDGRVLTAREFLPKVAGRLNLDTPDLENLTYLFELARYSEREITIEQARNAAVCFSTLSEALKKTMVPIGDISRQPGE